MLQQLCLIGDKKSTRSSQKEWQTLAVSRCRTILQQVDPGQSERTEAIIESTAVTVKFK